MSTDYLRKRLGHSGSIKGRHYIRSPEVGNYRLPPERRNSPTNLSMIGIYHKGDSLGYIEKLGLELPVKLECIWLDTGGPAEQRYQCITEFYGICVIRLILPDGTPVGWGDPLMEVAFVKRLKALVSRTK